MLSFIRRKLRKCHSMAENRKRKRALDKKEKKLRRAVASCGDKIEIWGDPELLSPKRLVIGDNCRINSHVYINARSGVTIGDNVTLSYGAKIISTGYDVESFLQNGDRRHREDTPIVIGDNIWICADAIILPGVKITGDHVIIAAGAVVNTSFDESNVLIAGNPAKIVKRYTE